jgi:hypothetical protein
LRNSECGLRNETPEETRNDEQIDGRQDDRCAWTRDEEQIDGRRDDRHAPGVTGTMDDLRTEGRRKKEEGRASNCGLRNEKWVMDDRYESILLSFWRE